MTLDIHALMQELSQSRPIFHSEADFQHALAWQIHEAMPDSQLRLEYPFRHDGSTMYLDIWLPTEQIAIELKYLTRRLEQGCQADHFALKEQSAHDTRQYDFLKDLQRLECAVMDEEQQAIRGVAVLLTNDPLYWDRSRGSVTSNYVSFRVFEGRKLTGEMTWSECASAGTKKGREAPIRLEGSYTMRWRAYSNFPGEKYGDFRYLAVEVQPQ